MFSEVQTRRPSLNNNYDQQQFEENRYKTNNNSNNNTIIYSCSNNYAPQLLSSLRETDRHRLISNQSHLTRPSFCSRQHEHRLSISLSFDAPASQNCKRRLMRNSSPRLSYSEDERNYTTLLTFARAAESLFLKFRHGMRRSVKSLFVLRPQKSQVASDREILEQTSWICTDYVVSRLTSRNLMSRKVELNAPNWPKSAHVINAGSFLEMTYPSTYSNVSRKLGVTMSSQKVVRNTLTLLLAVLFEGNITWGKVVSMFAVAGLFGEECVLQGHADFVKDVIAVVVDFTNSQLLQWLLSQGGWDAFPVHGGSERSRLSKLRLLILICGTSAVFLSSLQFLNVWSP